MGKVFNVTGVCIPSAHYMVNTDSRVDEIIETLISKGQYFTINRARQYGKTTLLYMLEERLKLQYLTLSLSFEAADELFISLYTLAAGLVRKIGRLLKEKAINPSLIEQWNRPVSREFPLDDLSDKITMLCTECGRKIVLMIDEVDKSSDNQIFLSLLGLLRAKYLDRNKGRDVTFYSVILAGVYDVKNLKLKLHPGLESKYNSPWNIAADFNVTLSFTEQDIIEMLNEYENDWHTGMDTAYIGRRIHEYTDGYPYLVSRICKLIDEHLPGTGDYPDKSAAWTESGLQSVVSELLKEPNSLFDDMAKVLEEYTELKKMLQDMLFNGTIPPYNQLNAVINTGIMFGFLKEDKEHISVANRIFETVLYNWFLSESITCNAIY